MAAMTTEMNPASTFNALLVVVVGVTLEVLLPVVEVPPVAVEEDGEVAVGEAVPDATNVAPLGSPKIVPSVGTGPIPADADAPIPTRPPTDCCKIQIVSEFILAVGSYVLQRVLGISPQQPGSS